MQLRRQETIVPNGPVRDAPVRPPACTLRSPSLCPSSPFSWYFTPSHPVVAFGSPQVHQTVLAVIPVLSSTLLPGFTGRDFITTTGSSATLHVISGLLESPLAGPPSLSDTSPSNDTGLPQLGQAPCERSHPHTRNRSDRVLDIALFCRLAAPVAPNQVRLRYVPLTSYGFLQTPPLPVTPLPFGLSSPRSG